MALLMSPEGQRKKLIAEIADELEKPEEEVEEVFNEEFDRLYEQARVKTYVALLTSRLVKQRLAEA